jgi:S1-C subfamily serine protease
MLRFAIRLGLVVAIGLVSATAGSRATSAEPSPAMLGVIPIDQAGQVIVQDVYVGGPAQVAGLRPGDRIIAVDEKAVHTAAELIETLAGFAPQARVEIRASRSGWIKQLTVTMAKRENVIGLRRSLDIAAPPPSSRTTVAPPGTASPSKVRKLEDPFYRMRNQRW